MLIRFVASNFLSLKEDIEFNMLTGSFKTHPHHVYKAGKTEVLRAAAIYGANGAGKSNLVKGIAFLGNIVNEGRISESVSREKFKLDVDYKHKPIEFEIEFFTEGKIYKYGLVIDHTSILKECLYESGITKTDKLIFERRSFKSHKSSIQVAEKYSKSSKVKVLIELLEETLLLNNELLLSKIMILSIPGMKPAWDWLTKGLFIMYPSTTFGNLAKLLADEDFELLANELLPSFDTGVVGLTTESIELRTFFGKDDKNLVEEILEELEDQEDLEIDTKQGTVLIVKEGDRIVVKKPILKHSGINSEPINFELTEESDGTKRLLDYVPVMDMIINYPVTIIIDEIDRSLHPHLVKTLLQKIMADPNVKGQLIFTTHESSLLDLNIFRQDEIWFAEKEKETGSTQFYSLSDFKPRYDLDIRKGYLNGRFGAIPFLGNLENLNWHSHAETE